MSLKITSFVSNNYIDIAANWIRHMEKLNLINQVTLVALDEESYHHFESYNIIYRPLEFIKNNEESLRSLWCHRIKVIQEFVKDGIDIIHSDLDAIWLNNPIYDIMSCESDLVFTQGTVWPIEFYKEHGFVLCCGLFYIQSSETTLNFLEIVEDKLNLYEDDQKTINLVLSEMVNNWEIHDPYIINSFKASKIPIKSSLDSNIKVSVLPHHLYPRVLFDRVTDEIMVAHPLSPKTRMHKIQTLSSLGLWMN